MAESRPPNSAKSNLMGLVKHTLSFQFTMRSKLLHVERWRMALELGDHIWYWNGNISLDKNIPRTQWFPSSSPSDPNDYQGHGIGIYQYVLHADEIARGQPHMKNKPGKIGRAHV